MKSMQRGALFIINIFAFSLSLSQDFSRSRKNDNDSLINYSILSRLARLQEHIRHGYVISSCSLFLGNSKDGMWGLGTVAASGPRRFEFVLNLLCNFVVISSLCYGMVYPVSLSFNQ